MKLFLLYTLSFLSSIGIMGNNFFNVIFMFPKKGYFVKSGKPEDYNKITESAKEYISTSTKFHLLLWVPVVNVLYALYLNHKINKKVFEKYINYPNFLKPMTGYEIREFKKIKGMTNKFEYLFDLSYGGVKKPIIDAISYEVINESDDEKQYDEKNSVIDEYRKLRDEVNYVNSSNNSTFEYDGPVLNKKM